MSGGGFLRRWNLLYGGEKDPRKKQADIIEDRVVPYCIPVFNDLPNEGPFV